MHKTIVIHHSADFDGLFCREIARKFLPHAELIGWDYGEAVPVIPEGSTLYMLDISVEGLMDYPRLIWIDHHKSAMEKFNPQTDGFRIDGVAACRLAWQWFAEYQIGGGGLPGKKQFIDRKVSEPLAVTLAGEYDIWDKRDARVDTLQFGLRSRELTPEDWDQLLSTKKPSVDELESLVAAGHKDILAPDGTATPATILDLLADGSLLQKYQRRIDAGMMERSFVTEFEGLNFLCGNFIRCNSLTFVSRDVPETGHDALLAFGYAGSRWRVSLYHAGHRKDIDLSVIAVKYGGGGHRGACGFEVNTLPFMEKD